MRGTSKQLFAVAVAASHMACGGCDTSEIPRFDVSLDARNGVRTDAGSSDVAQRDVAAPEMGRDVDRPDTDSDTGGGDAAAVDFGTDAAHLPDSAAEEGGTPDLGTAVVCGDGLAEPPEACDDGNTSDGDYCASDCSATTGACGDATRQANESCDDGVTLDCGSTHDGGDGACVPSGTCSNGYMLSGGQCVPANTTGLTVPCQNGAGWTLFRYHYDNNSTSAQIDVWDASCNYSFAPNSACNVREVYPGFGDVSRTSDGYPIFTSSNYMRVRFNVNGLNFTSATLWIRARSYATSSSTYYDAESILYGFREGGPVDNDFVYDWYELDWTGQLHPSDSPSLTAIQLYGGRGSGQLAVRGVELCVQ